ncbi:peroxisome assembly factor 2 [Aricia agestis]|uniref:peroxisome assembly factor 2 n=1 Tax=Aricia agestis TaxID=91739 RepID=UPI001C20B925|nr:peroxisome assembly factor 2 [Aricia agestis]
MKKADTVQLWVLKFCLKLVYPKFNTYAFIAYLAIKFRYFYNKKRIGKRVMSTYNVESIPDCEIIQLIAKNSNHKTLSIILEKCLIVHNNVFSEMCVENFFYKDNRVLWVSVKLSPEMRKKWNMHTDKMQSNNKYNFCQVTSEIHKKLWPETSIDNTLHERIVPVIGAERVPDDTIYTNEIEFENIVSCFGLFNIENIEISLHPVPNIDFSPKIAETAEVNLIVNEYDLSNDFVKEVLNNHFETPKLVSINDVICIELTPSIVGKHHYRYLDLVEFTGKLYFKCNKLSSNSNVPSNQRNVIPAYYIVKGVTQLTLGEMCHAIKPKNQFHSVSKTNCMCLKGTHICPTGLMKKFNEIQEIISPFLSGEIDKISSALQNPIVPIILLTGSMGSGRHMLVQVIAKYNGLNCLHIDCNALQSSTAKQTESKINSMFQKAKAAAPAIVTLDSFDVFGIDPENNEDQRVLEYFVNSITELYENYTKHPIIFVAVADKADLKPNIIRIFLEKIHIPKLNSEERLEVLQWFESVLGLNVNSISNLDNETISEEAKVDNSIISSDILQRVASKTETFLYGDLDTLMHFAMRESYLNQSRYIHISKDPDMTVIHEEDFNNALETIRGLQSQHLDAPKIPKVYWEDIGGLDKLKKELLKTIEFPIKFPHLFQNSSLKRSGILLYGPPGCGKTLVAKAVSTELNVSFMSVKGPELLNMYIGQSEENVRNVFAAARASSPCVVFLDELDALAPARGAAGDAGGASDRVVSQLLAELDGVKPDDETENGLVFVMGATNRPDLLEQSLLRPGRLDRLVYVPPYRGVPEKVSVLKALCRSYNLLPGVDLTAVAAALPERVTGADLLQVTDTARAAAVRALVQRMQRGLVKESELTADSVHIGMEELWQGVESFRPSITEEEMSYYESLQSQM